MGQFYDKATAIDQGAMRNLIELQHPTPTQQPNGEENLADDSQWTTYATVWADVRPLMGRELERGKSFGASINATATLRWLPNVTNKDRIVSTDATGRHTYAINAPIDVESKHVKLLIYCTEQF